MNYFMFSDLGDSINLCNVAYLGSDLIKNYVK